MRGFAGLVASGGAWRRLIGVRRWGRAVLAGAGLWALSSYAGPNLLTDLSSVSTGKTNAGRTRAPAKLPNKGKGFKVPDRWRVRGFQYGVDELVEAVVRAAARVHARDRRAKLGVADLSKLRGGSSRWHKSHHSGRDVDLLFYQTDEKGRPQQPPAQDMIAFDDDGAPYIPNYNKDGYHDEAWESRRFDFRRNWQLIEALLTDPTIRLQWVFVSNGLKFKLLREAHRRKRPQWIIDYAKVILRQPGDSRPHDNHFHVRVYCPRADRFHGCVDRGPVWQHEKKTHKYGGPEHYDPVAWRHALSTPKYLVHP